MIELKDHKVILRKWDSEREDWVRRILDDKATWKFAYETVDVCENFLLKDFFRVVGTNNWQVLLTIDAGPFIDEIKKEKVDKKYTEIKLSRGIEIYAYRDPREYCQYDDVTVKNEGENYGVDGIALNLMKDCKLNIDNELFCYEVPSGKKIELGTSNWTMLEIFHALMWEFSFYGTPEQRDKRTKELKEGIKAIEDKYAS